MYPKYCIVLLQKKDEINKLAKNATLSFVLGHILGSS